jgi:hypothetical protein
MNARRFSNSGRSSAGKSAIIRSAMNWWASNPHADTDEGTATNAASSTAAKRILLSY